MPTEYKNQSQDKPKPGKVEQKEFVFESDPDPLFQGYFAEIRNRSFQSRTDVDVERLVALELSSAPLTKLTDSELKELKEYLRKEAQNSKHSINRKYSGLAEHEIYWVDEVLIEKLKKRNRGSELFRPTFLDGTMVNTREVKTLDAIRDLRCSPLKPEELIKLLSDPNTLDSSSYVYFSEYDLSESLLGEGSRPLYAQNKGDPGFDYHYGYASAEDFKNTLDRIKQRTKKQNLIMLDIGGNVGRAVIDAKKIDPTLKTINMTLTYLPAIGGDILVRRPAEYMPAVFEENIDLIESNFAFRYFLFPDIALMNAVKALSIGGETDIGFTNDSCPLDKEELLKRMKKVFAWLKKLEQEGYIEVVKEGRDPFLIERAYFGRELKITKKKSTIGL